MYQALRLGVVRRSSIKAVRNWIHMSQVQRGIGANVLLSGLSHPYDQGFDLDDGEMAPVSDTPMPFQRPGTSWRGSLRRIKKAKKKAAAAQAAAAEAEETQAEQVHWILCN